MNVSLSWSPKRPAEMMEGEDDLLLVGRDGIAEEIVAYLRVPAG